ncbi:6476_t:CDS:2 [Entrophospora sp. SA101]|nr:6476_t:CDS:2 [Entrophospora sp. SA101]
MPRKSTAVRNVTTKRPVTRTKKDLNELDDNTLNIDGLNSWDKYIKLNNENQY